MPIILREFQETSIRLTFESQRLENGLIYSNNDLRVL